MLTCGIWATDRGLLARCVASDGRAHPPVTLGDSIEQRTQFVERLDDLYSPDWELVLPARLTKSDPLMRIAQRHHVPVWVVPAFLVNAVRTLSQGPQFSMAELLARMPRCPFLRRTLRRISPVDSGQLDLL